MHGRLIRIFLLGLGLLLFFAKTTDAACPLPANKLHYDVFNDDHPVGGVWVDFTRNGEMTKVSTLIKVKVKLFFLIPILNYRHQSEEIWVEDSFHRFTGRTVDNGRATDIRITPNGEGFDVNKNGDVSKIATPLLSPAIWCEGTLKSPKIFSPLKGRMKDVRSEYLGEAVISAAGRDRPTRTYAVTQMRKGKPTRGNIWYGEDGVVVKARFPSKRGTMVTFLLQ